MSLVTQSEVTLKSAFLMYLLVTSVCADTGCAPIQAKSNPVKIRYFFFIDIS